MKPLVQSFFIVMKRKDSIAVAFVASIFFLLLLLFIQNGSSAFDILSLRSLPFEKSVILFFTILFDFESTFTTSTFIVAIVGSILGGYNLALLYTYIMNRGELIVKSGLYSGSGLIFAFFGIGCAACGTAVLSALLGFFGLSGALALLPYGGQEIGYLGIIILVYATYSLAKKVIAPNVC